VQDAERLEHLEAEIFRSNCLGELILKNEIERGRCWVIEEASEVVAYLLAHVADGLIDIMRLGVLADHRRHGYAKALLQRALEEAPRAVLTVKKDNLAAMALYRRFGFEIVGRTDSQNWLMLRATASSS
jgi:ribosomal protein S18 acetylase RimI-like enzyme